MDALDDRQRAITVVDGQASLDGDLTIPDAARAVVLFAHGAGSSRHSPRNQYVAGHLALAGFATLLMDLLTADEERVDAQTRSLRFDIPLLARRLTAAVDWLTADDATAEIPVVTFGASTGAAAALITAAERPDRVHGVISRGGRADLAGDALTQIAVPVLLIVGGADPIVIDLNERAATSLGHVQIEIVPGATHLFEEMGALDAVIQHALDALNRWLPQSSVG